MLVPALLDRSLADRPVLRTPGFVLVLVTAAVGLLSVASAPSQGARLVELLAASVGLGALVRNYRALQRLLRERMRAEAAARTEALTDELTGLYNRRGFRALADHQLRIARRSGGDLLMLCLDLDRFKPINDRFGHAEGDRALTEVAAVLRATMRDTDVIARLGGDEFAVLVVGADDATEDAILSRLYRALAQRNGQPGRQYLLSATIGASRLDEDRGADLDDLLRTADAALYRAKRAGRLQAA
ncbi:GGDEF domain-containing protein [Roseisolibacter sp. H3M3-2]|uniref:GGDEF domain-containing protein n=1 Tax=Roseisolibacter sp. H3M3-2 TaxID=3031323 RepID=UPI0023D9DFCB|nr:GGDEF domain-containing protein [Roseisolibacter sp. H3M3-2]MDF1504281.1 GGDEF domain-containing protein [Roseisolibacter sp. H3M3-2]